VGIYSYILQDYANIGHSLGWKGKNFLYSLKNYWLWPDEDLHAGITAESSKFIFSSSHCHLCRHLNNLKEEPPRLNADDGSRKNGVKEVMEKRCQILRTREYSYLRWENNRKQQTAKCLREVCDQTRSWRKI